MATRVRSIRRASWALSSLIVIAAAAALWAAAIQGAFFVTDSGATTVIANTFAAKADVYLGGGPQHGNPNGLPDGDYYFQVTDPSGAVLLSSDVGGIACRKLKVLGGVVVGATGACPHTNGTLNVTSGITPVQLLPFNDTPNPGGEYKAWVTPVGDYDATLACAGSFGFCN